METRRDTRNERRQRRGTWLTPTFGTSVVALLAAVVVGLTSTPFQRETAGRMVRTRSTQLCPRQSGSQELGVANAGPPQEWVLTVCCVPSCPTEQLLQLLHRVCTGLGSLDHGPPHRRFSREDRGGETGRLPASKGVSTNWISDAHRSPRWRTISWQE